MIIPPTSFKEYRKFYENMHQPPMYPRSEEDINFYQGLMVLIEQEGDDEAWIYNEKYPCRIHRNHMGNWCGYVGLPYGHPAYGMDYDKVSDKYPKLEVHGGLTFSDFKHEWAKDNIWFLGFDTAHAYDITPSILFMCPRIFPDTTYKTKAYTENETNSLACQLEKIEKKEGEEQKKRKRRKQERK